jgi:hypothetical protein
VEVLLRVGRQWRPIVALGLPGVLGPVLGLVGSGDEPLLGLVVGAVLGLLTGSIALFVLLAAQRSYLVSLASPGPAVPPRGQGLAAWLVPVPTPFRTLVADGDRHAHRLDRGLRRTRSAALLLLVVLYPAARAWQLLSFSAHGEADVPGALLLGLVGAAVVWLAVTVILRCVPRTTATDPLPIGSLLTKEDDDRLRERFPDAPLLRHAGHRSARGGIRVPWTVDGLAGKRYWWVTVRQGAVYDDRGLRRTRRRSTCLVWLPGLELPSVALRGRDSAAVADWFREGLPFESWDFNERWYVEHEAGCRRWAVALLHPRAMSLIDRSLPDGATLVFSSDTLCLSFERVLVPGEVAGIAAFALALADLVPVGVLHDLRDKTYPVPRPSRAPAAASPSALS